MKLIQHITAFFAAVEKDEIEIYNEFSLQHELGIYLRNNLGKCKIQFERNVSHFELPKSDFEKKEIDIVITSMTASDRPCAIELKYPRNGQVPESMFSFCKDILFLEQLVASGFQPSYFLAVADSPLFYSGKNDGIYGHFRSNKLITGDIHKPTGTTKDSKLSIRGSYNAVWLPISGTKRFCLIKIAVC